ncbi:response regulator transcription factor [Pedobacter rhodius]|uniref:Response regulator n=1 Tax=Pedobacter rhodius TaxID=3004098 RepID=A0ABT4KVK8_9SPHI|nr:response regulator [Pedobacter sp. SJ11]MCZ4222956.1 response regulator [Pedobacter sp. SJ11]
MAKIFILEDDRDIREVVELILRLEDYQVVSFENVKNFMNRDLNDIPDLFILDIMLPDGSGLEVCNMLRIDTIHQHIPIIIMSAHASTEQVSAGCRADAFLQKPFELTHFLDTIVTQINADSSLS